MTVPVRPDGSFVAKGLRPGIYTATALIAGSGDGAPDAEVGSIEVTIENADVTGVLIDLRP